MEKEDFTEIVKKMRLNIKAEDTILIQDCYYELFRYEDDDEIPGMLRTALQELFNSALKEKVKNKENNQFSLSENKAEANEKTIDIEQDIELEISQKNDNDLDIEIKIFELKKSLIKIQNISDFKELMLAQLKVKKDIKNILIQLEENGVNLTEEQAKKEETKIVAEEILLSDEVKQYIEKYIDDRLEQIASNETRVIEVEETITKPTTITKKNNEHNVDKFLKKKPKEEKENPIMKWLKK